MDWAESQDLIDIFLAEVDERAARLIAGAVELRAGRLASFTAEDLTRDAHTLKGSSNMLGKVDLGSASGALERTWKAITEGELSPSPATIDAMGSLSRLILDASRDDQARQRLAAATATLASTAERQAPSAALLNPAAERLRDHAPMEVSNFIDDPVESDAPPEVGAAHGDANLGGLLATVRDELSSAVTRVDTGDLYRLINRAVDIGLDTEALADLTHVAFEGADPVKLLVAWRAQLERLSADVTELQEWAVSLANVPLRDATESYPQFVRFLGRRLGREVRFDIQGGDLLIDRQIVDLIREPLRHLIVNAVDHGIETTRRRVELGKSPTGTIRLDAEVVEDRLIVSVSDDGSGIDWDAVLASAETRGLGVTRSELEAHLFRPGFTTVSEPNEFSGSGEGLSLVADSADRVGGTVAVESTPGVGSRFTMDLPVSLVVQNIVIVASGDQFFGIAEPAVAATAAWEISTVQSGVRGREIMFRSEAVPVVSFSRALSLPPSDREEEVLFLKSRSGYVAVTVDEIIDRRRVAVKSLGPILEDADHLVGAAFLGGGEVLVMIDHNHLGGQARRPEAQLGTRPRVLVVDDSAGVRQIISATLRGRGFDVTVAPGAREAVEEMSHAEYDALVVDYSMPRSNGVELVRALRHNDVKLPIVMVSAVAEDDDKARAWEAGVDAYLDKYDIRQGALVAALRRLLEEGNGRD
ncbi:MAG TPA: response regulator [Acidimicrobiia bacterium]|nr:response regulator [Acidimicrobiia bacterium]